MNQEIYFATSYGLLHTAGCPTDSDEQLNSYAVQVSLLHGEDQQQCGVDSSPASTPTRASPAPAMKHREDFKRMLRACREGRIDLILCKSVCRFGRNSVDVLRTIRALRERGIGVVFEKEGCGHPHHELRA